jgi:hypothetical protein
MKGAYAEYADRFRLPGHDEMDRLAKAALGAGSVASPLADAATASNVFTVAVQSMHTPWLLHDNSAQSARAFAEIQAIGHGLRNFAPFSVVRSAVSASALCGHDKSREGQGLLLSRELGLAIAQRSSATAGHGEPRMPGALSLEPVA